MKSIRKVFCVFLLLSLTLVPHELGHLAAAFSMGIPVESFQIGVGPSVTLFEWRGTLFKVGLLPVFGFVHGSEVNQSPSKESYASKLISAGHKPETIGPLLEPSSAFDKQSFGRRLVLYFAGMTVNFFFGVILLTACLRKFATRRLDLESLGWLEALKIALIEASDRARRISPRSIDRLDSDGDHKIKIPEPSNVGVFFLAATVNLSIIGCSIYPIFFLDGWNIFWTVGERFCPVYSTPNVQIVVLLAQILALIVYGLVRLNRLRTPA